MDDPLIYQPLCSVCGTSEFQLIRTDELVTTVFVDTAQDVASRDDTGRSRLLIYSLVWACVKSSKTGRGPGL